jgi:putative addiction module component (TIGR02574 family)
MATHTLTELLALPGPQRLELAMALWQSLESGEQEQALAIEPELAAELDRRWARHQQQPQDAVSWDVVRQDLGLA